MRIQSEHKEIACSAGNANDQVPIVLSFAFDWSREGREFLGSHRDQRNS